MPQRRCNSRLPGVAQLAAMCVLACSAAASTDLALAFLTSTGTSSRTSRGGAAFRASHHVERYSLNRNDSYPDGVGRASSPTTTGGPLSTHPTMEDLGFMASKTNGSLFGTAYDMVCASMLIYRYASLLRKNGDFKALLEPPISIDRALYVILDHIDVLFDVCSKEEAKNVLRALHTLSKHSSDSRASEWIAFEDPLSNKECAYGILVNHELKRCTVVFRGSDNNSDFVQDGKIPMVKKNNPVRETRDQIGSILIHKGFDEYLFARGNKVYQIKTKVEKYVQEGYSLYFTGHSLGGALATIAGFYTSASTAAELKLPSPGVQVYTFGSPRVGDKCFYDAFLCLESRNKIRHARFHNRMDLVARSPSHALPPNMMRYSHVGMDITLQVDKPPKLMYAPSIKDEDNSLRALLSSESFRDADLTRFPAAGGSVGGMVSKGMYHDVATYIERIKRVHDEEKFPPMTLEEAYQQMMRRNC